MFFFNTPCHVSPPHFFTYDWSTYSKLNPSTVTMVVFCCYMVRVRRFMKVFLGVYIIMRLLNMSEAGGERCRISGDLTLSKQ